MWDPGIQYRGDQWIAQAAQQISKSLLDDIQQYRQTKQEDNFGDEMMQYLAHTPSSDGTAIVSPEMLTEFTRADHDTKAGLLRAAQTKAAMDQTRTLQRAQEGRLDAVAAKQNALADAQTNRLTWRPTQEDRNTAYSLGGDYIQTPQGWVFQRYSDSGDNGGAPQLQPDVVTVRPPGEKPFNVFRSSQNAFSITPGSQSGGHPMVGQPYYDPDTGEQTGTYRADGSIQYKPNRDPAKQAEAELIQKLGGNANGGAATNGGPPPATPPPVPVAPQQPQIGKVRVISPQGQPGFIPQNRLQDYLAAGYKQG